MKVRPYVPSEPHNRIVQFAREHNLDVCEAYSRIIQLTLDKNGVCISECQDDRRKTLEEAKRSLLVYINSTQCKWCVSRAKIIHGAMEELITLHIKASDFVQQLENCDNITSLEDKHGKR